MSLPTIEETRRALAEGSGAGVKIGILDSGVETAHPALAGLELADDVAIVSGEQTLEIQSGEGIDVFGHGTAIAYVIRQLAPEAKLSSIRVLGEGLRSRTEIIREGVRQAYDLDCDILNCSFGCRGDGKYVMSYKEWVDEGYLLGRHIVAACNNSYMLLPEWPAYFPTVIATNMAVCKEEDRIFRRPGNLIEFAARGVDVSLPWRGGEYKTVTGSSYAAPRLAALLARLLSVHPGLSVLAAKELLLRVAEPFTREAAGPNAPERLFGC
jgi:subtilisin family serine protease